MNCRKVIAFLVSVCVLLAPLAGHAALSDHALPHPAQIAEVHAFSADCHVAMQAHDPERGHAPATPADDGVSDCAAFHACCSGSAALPAPVILQGFQGRDAPPIFVARLHPRAAAAEIFRPPRFPA